MRTHVHQLRWMLHRGSMVLRWRNSEIGGEGVMSCDGGSQTEMLKRRVGIVVGIRLIDWGTRLRRGELMLLLVNLVDNMMVPLVGMNR
jgi:hypothetical protein